MKEIFNIDMERCQSVTIFEDGCLSTCAQNGDNPQVDLDEDQTRKIYEELHKIYGAKDT